MLPLTKLERLAGETDNDEIRAAAIKEFKARIVSEEQKQLLQRTTMQCGRNAWEYMLTRPKDDQHWIAVGILSCMKKGYSLNRLTINWEARDLRSL
ncbi:MAG: hypothetical protein IKP33_01765 [Prevotella sp.]|nr:hypothetical protein [Prevotella sp.]